MSILNSYNFTEQDILLPEVIQKMMVLSLIRNLQKNISAYTVYNKYKHYTRTTHATHTTQYGHYTLYIVSYSRGTHNPR